MSQSGVRSVFDKLEILPTPQRLEVAAILLEKPQHLSADQIIERLRVAGSAVSKATVYNTLNLFSQRGLVKEVMVDPVRKFYDSTTHPHHHFYNVDTGELQDIDTSDIQISQLPELPPATVAAGVDVVIRVRSATAVH